MALESGTVVQLTTFGLALLEHFKHRNDVVSEEEITVFAKEHYENFLKKNAELQERTK